VLQVCYWKSVDPPSPTHICLSHALHVCRTGKDGKAGASGRDRSGKPSAPLVPQGAAKAQALIAAALEEANAAIAAKRAAEPAAQHVQPADSGDGDAAGDDDEDGAAESAAAPVEPASAYLRIVYIDSGAGSSGGVACALLPAL
jgi:hypothetical protein